MQIERVTPPPLPLDAIACNELSPERRLGCCPAAGLAFCALACAPHRRRSAPVRSRSSGAGNGRTRPAATPHRKPEPDKLYLYFKVLA